MAQSPFLTDPSNPISPEILGLERQRKLAEMLQQRGMQTPQGQMVSGRFVAPSFTQYLANAFDTYAGAQGQRDVDQKQAELAKGLRAAGATETQDILSTMRGRQPIPEIVPQGQTLLDDQGMPTMGAQRGVAGIAPDMQAAYAKSVGASTPQGQSLAPLLAKQLMREPNFKEVNIVNPKTGDTETYRYDANAADPTKTYQLLGVNKPALSPADRIRFKDEGIDTNVGGAPAMSNQPVVSPQVNAPIVKPATNVKSDDLVKAFGYDPFVPPPPPASIVGGKDLRNYKLDQAKPLTGTAADQVTGAKLYADTLTKYNDYIDGLSTTDLLNPSVRVKVTSLHSQAKLAGKEANKLGVLNGGDEVILDKILPDFKDITVTKKNLKGLIQDQKEFGTGIIVNAYGTQQKAVPDNMRKYIVLPQQVGTETKSPAPVQKAILNNRQIETRNGVWVDSQTGKRVN
jgi:hypothetical protein